MKRYQKIMMKLKNKFEKLREEKCKKQQQQQPQQRPSTLKESVLQLQQQQLPPEAIDVLNLGPNFVVSP